jgi:hypothetical protein
MIKAIALFGPLRFIYLPARRNPGSQRPAELDYDDRGRRRQGKTRFITHF